MNLLLALGLTAATLGATAGSDSTATATAADSIKGFVFTDVITIPTTSVKDQNKSGTCWCFAGTSHLEDEILHNGGDSLNLSEMLPCAIATLTKPDAMCAHRATVIWPQAAAYSTCHTSMNATEWCLKAYIQA